MRMVAGLLLKQSLKDNSSTNGGMVIVNQNGSAVILFMEDFGTSPLNIIKQAAKIRIERMYIRANVDNTDNILFAGILLFSTGAFKNLMKSHISLLVRPMSCLVSFSLNNISSGTYLKYTYDSWFEKFFYDFPAAFSTFTAFTTDGSNESASWFLTPLSTCDVTHKFFVEDWTLL